jgi:hypothetical protein
MTILLLTGTLLILVALSLYGYKRLLELRERRLANNEYQTATTIWDFARFVKSVTDEMMIQRTTVLDFSRITVPSGAGYKISLELSGLDFRIFGTPHSYSKTGRLSFYSDNSLTVRACDHRGEPATEVDPEYTGPAPS